MLIMLKWMLEQQLIQVNGNLRLAVDSLFNFLLPLFVWTLVFCPGFVMHY